MERDGNGERRALPHGLSLQERQKLAISGVSDVVNFDETQVIVATGLGTLTIRGSGLHVDQLSLESGELRVTGSIDLLEYDDSRAPGGGFFRRLFQ
ncbi:MAG TPA: sporulation protein YabP [Candidatus Butyricicoccus stercorigallinarum]|nr:sporulation protein YabP [Candidatus Butyricicoccus stercorigallinarum]